VRPYAEAVFAAAGGVAGARQVLDELALVSSALDGEPKARELLSFPAVAPEVVGALLDALAGRCSPVAGRCLRVLVRRGRIRQLPALVEALRRRVEGAEGVVRAALQTARPLGAGDLEALRQALGRRFGGRVELVPEVRPDLIGGARVVVGDRVLDASLAAQLERLGRRLKAGA
jgi:F-type H+-transporting ATPase subunit delta